MRAPTRTSPIAAVAAFAGLVVLGTGLAADAKPRKHKTVDQDLEDVSAVKKDLVLLTDGEGITIAVVPSWNDEHWFFVLDTDGKTFYRQRVFSGGADGGAGTWDLRFWSPRVDSQADLEQKVGNKFLLTCGKDEVELTKVDAAQAKKTIDGAVFKKSMWKRQAQFLARDDKGNYYYVDRLRDDFGGKGYRIFFGQKGAMKEMPMTNLVSDSVGEIYATKRGELRFITSTSAATWVNGEAKTTLTLVPADENATMIYRDLGVYTGSLGTPCDDF